MTTKGYRVCHIGEVCLVPGIERLEEIDVTRWMPKTVEYVINGHLDRQRIDDGFCVWFKTKKEAVEYQCSRYRRKIERLEIDIKEVEKKIELLSEKNGELNTIPFDSEEED